MTNLPDKTSMQATNASFLERITEAVANLKPQVATTPMAEHTWNYWVERSQFNVDAHVSPRYARYITEGR